MSDREFLNGLGPTWHCTLRRVVERSVFSWLMNRDSEMWQKESIYIPHQEALALLQQVEAGE